MILFLEKITLITENPLDACGEGRNLGLLLQNKNSQMFAKQSNFSTVGRVRSLKLQHFIDSNWNSKIVSHRKVKSKVGAVT